MIDSTTNNSETSNTGYQMNYMSLIYDFRLLVPYRRCRVPKLCIKCLFVCDPYFPCHSWNALSLKAHQVRDTPICALILDLMVNGSICLISAVRHAGTKISLMQKKPTLLL